VIFIYHAYLIVSLSNSVVRIRTNSLLIGVCDYYEGDVDVPLNAGNRKGKRNTSMNKAESQTKKRFVPLSASPLPPPKGSVAGISALQETVMKTESAAAAEAFEFQNYGEKFNFFEAPSFGYDREPSFGYGQGYGRDYGPGVILEVWIVIVEEVTSGTILQIMV
jgi:hypothetical protein